MRARVWRPRRERAPGLRAARRESACSSSRGAGPLLPGPRRSSVMRSKGPSMGSAPTYERAFEVQADRHHRYRATSRVVAGVRDELVIHRQGDPAQDLHQIVRLEDRLRAIAEPTVTKLESEPPMREVVSMHVAQPVGGEAEAPVVLGPVPPRLRDLCAGREGPLGFRVRKRLGRAVIPPEATKESRVPVLGER